MADNKITSGTQVAAAVPAEAPVKAKRIVNRGPRITRLIVHVEDGKAILDGVYANGDAHKMLEDYDRLVGEGKNPQRLQHVATGK